MKNKLRKKRVKVKKEAQKVIIPQSFTDMGFGEVFYNKLHTKLLMDYYKAENKAFYGHR